MRQNDLRLSLRVDPSLREQLEARARLEGRSVSNLVRRYLQRQLDQ